MVAEKRNGSAGPTIAARLAAWEHRLDPRVLIVEDESILGDLFERWLDDRFATERVGDEEAAVDALADSVVTAVVCENFADGTAARVTRVILERLPHCQIVLVRRRSVPSRPGTAGADEVLVEPVEAEGFTDAIRSQYYRGLYKATLKRYLHISAAITQREVQYSPDALADDPGYADLQRALDRTNDALGALEAALDTEDFDALFDSLEVRKEFYTRPEVDETDQVDDKYHPDTCPNCGLLWGVSHGKELGDGYTVLGAYVYRCADCEQIVTNPDPTDRKIARR